MDPDYTESRNLVPRVLAHIITGMFAATVLFMAVSGSFGAEVSPAFIILATVVFALVSAAAYLLRYSVKVDASGVTVAHAMRTVHYPAEDLVDVMSGELSEIRCYSQWDLKGVKRRSFACVGDEYGVALKVKGMRVVVLASGDPSTLEGAIRSIIEVR